MSTSANDAQRKHLERMLERANGTEVSSRFPWTLASYHSDKFYDVAEIVVNSQESKDILEKELRILKSTHLTFSDVKKRSEDKDEDKDIKDILATILLYYQDTIGNSEQKRIISAEFIDFERVLAGSSPPGGRIAHVQLCVSNETAKTNLMHDQFAFDFTSFKIIVKDLDQ